MYHGRSKTMSRPVAVITGASAGIGETFARALAARGYDLILVARRADRLAELARELESAGNSRVETLAADLASDAGIQAVEQRLASCDALHVLVNNAGFGTKGYFAETDVDSQDQMHRLHVLATMRLSHAALQVLARRNDGAIINVASVAGFWQSPHNVSYCATKTWMNSFTEGLSYELRARGSQVRVQALCPGYTYTEFHDVMGVGRGGAPQGWWLDSRFVVSESLRGMDRGTLFVVPGLRYKIVVAAMKIMPRWIRERVALSTSRRYRGR
jgi:uncharacterized protein